jgi:hypothetical protein
LRLIVRRLWHKTRLDIYRETPHPSGAKPNPLMEIALACARRGWTVMPVRPYWLHPHIQYPCSYGEPICLATGWHALPLESFLHATSNEDTIRDWWTKWPDAYVCLLAAVTPGLKVRPWTKPRPRKDEAFGIVVFGYRAGQIRLSYAGPVIWDERKEAHRAFREWWAKVRDQPKYHGWIEFLTPKDLAMMLPSTEPQGGN